ncbi:MAG: hypothetical protein ACE5KE_13560 [Methanosarcinales archaeon]
MKVGEKIDRFLKGIIGTGMMAWIFQRITGLILVVILLIHIINVHYYIQTGEHNQLVIMLSESVIFIPLMLSILLYHALNGLLVILIDMGISKKTHLIIFYIFIFFGISVFLIEIYNRFKQK